jgi:putative spermidine/putrescine transport system ATP-binding protein/spermidine/putrescine transport system ATP-binding protein
VTYDLQLVRVAKVYDNGTPAVVDFDLDVVKGEFIAFLGPSGCGKTTTLRMIAGFETITAGDLLIRDRHMNEIPAERRPTAMIFQNYALFPHMTVRRNVSYGLEVKRWPKARRDAKVDGMLAKLGIADVAERRPDQLSGGQRQRVALARALVVEPEILLLDEPLGALDANLRKTIQAELKLLQRNLGLTFVFVTHAQSEALTMSDRIVVMNQGRIEQISTPHELYRRPRTPFVAQFIGRNTIFSGRLETIEGGLGRVATGHGRFAGAVHGAVAAGASATIVVPSEAFDVHAAAEVSRESLADVYRGNVLNGVVEQRDVIGHLVQLAVTLDGGRSVMLEYHVEKYRRDALDVSAPVWLAWRSHEATVIAT